MKVHLIAIGGAVMHNMALALHEKGYEVSGSDDEIRDPSRTRLNNAGLLPPESGWFKEKITADLDAIILGMHARENNPELKRAQELSIPVYSFPEFVYNNSQNKTRVVIAGSHGKTTTTSMVMHALRKNGVDFDYLVGAQLEGFDTMVRLSDAPVVILEGDEYLSSPLDNRPKFLHYEPNVLLITGIAWDHVNVFPDERGYFEQFNILLQNCAPNAELIYYEGDEALAGLAAANASQFSNMTPYRNFGYEPEIEAVLFDGRQFPITVFGEHNLANMQGAMRVCETLSIPPHRFLQSMSDFKGAALRMELLFSSEKGRIYRDFAHAPSKVKATINAFAGSKGPNTLVTVLELHTFSSLNKDFIGQYNGSLSKADKAYVYYNPETVKHKKLKELQPQDVALAFGSEKVEVINSTEELERLLFSVQLNNTWLVLMSSGNLGGISIEELVKKHKEK